MHDTAVVVTILENNITVIPIIKDACLNCKEGCAKRGHSFVALNSKNLPVKVGSVVKIGTQKKQEIFQAITSVFFPLLCAVIGYFLANPISEKMQALCSLLGFLLAATIIFLLSKTKIKLAKPEITEICI